MNIYVRITCLLTLLFTITMGAMHRTTLLHILKTLEDGRCTTIEHEQDKALHLTSLKDKLTNQDLDCLINILIFGNGTKTLRFNHIASRINLIDPSIKAFSGTPGFEQLIRNLLSTSLNPNSNKSAWYQLGVAYYIYNNLYIHIQGFGCPSDFNKTLSPAYSFGIISDTQWTFCKTVTWDRPMYDHGRRKKNLKRSIMQQHALVETFNKSTGHELKYTICAQYPPSAYWAHWIAQNNIPLLFIHL